MQRLSSASNATVQSKDSKSSLLIAQILMHTIVYPPQPGYGINLVFFLATNNPEINAMKLTITGSCTISQNHDNR